MTTPDPRIESYRAAAAKLGESLAKGSPPDHVSMQEALTILGLLSNQTWLVEAAHLRLLVEAEMLEQEDRPDQPRCTAWRVVIEYQAELGSLVRQWREGVRDG